MQSESDAQVVPHAPVAVLHLKATHVVPVACTWQLLGAVHVCGSACVRSLLHVVPPHEVPTAQYAHAGVALPSHAPSWPQVDFASCAHSLSGSVPALTEPHVPLGAPVLALLHAWHRPEQAELQQ